MQKTTTQKIVNILEKYINKTETEIKELNIA